MIDTIKFGIPLSKRQFEKLQQRLIEDETWQWVRFQGSTGEIRFVRRKGLSQSDQHSFHRNLIWQIPNTFEQDKTFLDLELSLPKFWYGHNIHLLYDFLNPLKALKTLLEHQLHCRFVDVLNWRVSRLDVCYAWRCPSQLIAKSLLDSLKHLSYPRKQPTIYPNSIYFSGGKESTYIFKFYLKLPEFRQHDLPALIKEKYSYDWINQLEKKAEGVLRCEASLKRKYLIRKQINTIQDLVNQKISIIFDEEFINNYSHYFNEEDIETPYPAILIDMVFAYYSKQKNKQNEYEMYKTCDEYEQISIKKTIIHLVSLDIEPEVYFHAPSHTTETGFGNYIFAGGGFLAKKTNNPINLLNYFINRFLGKNIGMNTEEEIEVKLLSKYKPVKATRLMAFWLYVQRFGSDKAREMFGRDSYYRSKHDLKVAEVSLIEPPKVVDASDRFMKEFKFEIPSPYVTNTVDDDRDSDNIINLFQYHPATKKLIDDQEEQAKQELKKQKEAEKIEKLKKHFKEKKDNNGKKYCRKTL